MNKNDSNVTRKLDITGKVCPLTFVYTKLELETMKSGEILEITLDFPGALKNIPESCERQSLGKLLEVKEINSDGKATWLMKIQKF